MTIQDVNKQVAENFSKFGVHRIQITAVGNSISSGYSMCHEIKPLLEYNETLKSDIPGLSCYHFARAQDNCDAHIYRMLRENVRLSDVHVMNRRDYSTFPKQLPLACDRNGRVVGMTSEKMEKYYPLYPVDNPSLKDLITPSFDTLSVVIYNGGTGSFLDNNSRCGNHKLTYGIKRDMSAIDSFLEEVSIVNDRYSDYIPTQVYLCGAPKYFLPVQEFINTRLRMIAKRHAVATFVEPVRCSLVQRCTNGRLGVDFHYSEEQYFYFNYNIMHSIAQNYVVNKSVITTSSKMRKRTMEWFYSNYPSTDTKEVRKEELKCLFQEQIHLLEMMEADSSLYTSKMQEELKENQAHEYYSLVKGIRATKLLSSIK